MKYILDNAQEYTCEYFQYGLFELIPKLNPICIEYFINKYCQIGIFWKKILQPLYPAASR